MIIWSTVSFCCFNKVNPKVLCCSGQVLTHCPQGAVIASLGIRQNIHLEVVEPRNLHHRFSAFWLRSIMCQKKQQISTSIYNFFKILGNTNSNYKETNSIWYRESTENLKCSVCIFCNGYITYPITCNDEIVSVFLLRARRKGYPLPSFLLNIVLKSFLQK